MEELKTRLDKLHVKYGSSDADWVLFVQDHKTYLLDNSIKTDISQTDMFDFRYRPEEYLVYVGIEKSATWIVLWLNQISYNNFTNISNILLPSMLILSKLKTQYITNKLKKQKVFDKYAV